MRCPAGLGRHRRGLRERGRDWKQCLFRMMIGHHEGAIDMAKTEQAQGSYGPAKTMAKSIITSQSTEITEMNTLLGK
ncbi:DUF305 domain-containing protein [Streptomyces cyaneofuscatus]|uniref:DUF305 domain-containing protein n=1 Tax=Streptomyces cyaneofuscatus TaxID=66883 RepID=UPI003CED8697